MRESLQNIKIQPLPYFGNEIVEVAILRLDLLHPVVSGNKWFKLQYYLQDALATQKNKSDSGPDH
jgi:1-aminocyclopropane-1-carboxylate deaminase